MGNGCKCKHRIAKPTRSKSMNQISRNHKTGGLNFKYEIWAVSEGYFPPRFQCSRGSCMPSVGERGLTGWSRGLRLLIGNHLPYTGARDDHPTLPISQTCLTAVLPSTVGHRCCSVTSLLRCLEGLPSPSAHLATVGNDSHLHQGRSSPRGEVARKRHLYFVPQTFIRESHCFE